MDRKLETLWGSGQFRILAVALGFILVATSVFMLFGGEFVKTMGILPYFLLVISGWTSVGALLLGAWATCEMILLKVKLADLMHETRIVTLLGGVDEIIETMKRVNRMLVDMGFGKPEGGVEVGEV